MSDNLKSMSRKQLEKLAKDVQKALNSIEAKEKREAKKAAEKAARKFGFSLSDLTGPAKASEAPKRAKSAKKPAAAPKYANPADGSQTWTGKGRQPAWYKAAIEGGAAPESMEI